MVLSASPTFTGVPIAPTAAPGTNTTQIATTAFALANGIPSGAIVLWSGSVASIPSGWFLCDGSNSTPDLRSRFVVGAGSTYAVDATGGSADAVVVSHTHTATSTDSGHTHNAITKTSGSSSSGSQFTNSFDGSVSTTSTQMIQTGNANITTTIASAGVSGTNANLPPYYALAYIMKA
jgi:microcystin-dependent protein